MSVPALSRAGVDRVSVKRDDEDWLALAWDRGRLLVVDRDARASVDDDGPALILVDSASWDGSGPRLLLGVDSEDRAYWGTVAHELPARLGARPMDLRSVGAALDDRDAGLLVALVALGNWHANHTHCPRCGGPTRVTQAGWSRTCDVDGSQHFPRTDPAVIVLLHDGADRALLGRQPTWPPGRYSTIAGFVEAGESAEQAVHREVLEETGVTVTDVSYRGSQPWPYPASLMLGYEARVSGGEASAADHELEDVRWFTRTELRTGSAVMPPNASIAYWLITGWLARA
ncbi:MAG TPA: NAD(+) diphosphatase [Mycobacteriales bacterium]|nr:NAD(+) diphosphatase [Mycobacteriales bacterium]